MGILNASMTRLDSKMFTPQLKQKQTERLRLLDFLSFAKKLWNAHNPPKKMRLENLWIQLV